jgi:hypothetical protein
MKPISCANPALTKNVCGKGSRIVFKSTGEDHSLNMDELENHNLQAFGEEHIGPTPEGGPQGLTGDQLLDYRILGTRRSLQRWNQGILNKAYSEGLSKRMKQNVSREHLRGVHHHFVLPTGFFARARHWVRRKLGGEVRIRLEEHYGGGETVETAQTQAAANTLNPLTPAQRDNVRDFFENNGFPLPPLPAVIPAGLRGLNPMLIRQILQLTEAPLNIIEFMRGQVRDAGGLLFPPAPNDPFRPAMERTPEHPIEYLIEAKKMQGERLEQQNSTAINDPRRLGAFLRDLQDHHKEIHELIVKDILKEHSFDTLTKNHSAMRLLRYVETRLALKADETVLKEDLEAIKKAMPKVKAKKKEAPKEGEKSEAEEKAESEKLKEQTKSFTDKHSKLNRNYTLAKAVKEQVDDAKKKLADAIDKNAKDTSGLSKTLEKKEEKMNSLLEDTMTTEEEILAESAKLYKMLKDKDKTEAETNPKFTAFYDKFVQNPPKPSDEKTMCGTGAGPDSFYMVITDSYGPKMVQEFKDEMDEKFGKKFEKKEKYDCFELHVALRERDAERKGTYTAGERRTEAVAAVMMDEAKAMLIEVDRSANREHQEWLASGPLTRAKKWLKARMGMKGMHTARDFIDHVSGFDHDFSMFRGMKKDITDDELLNLIDTHGGISDVKLFEFQKKLTEVFNGFEMLHHGGKVELFDMDAYDLQQLIHAIAKVRAVLWTRTGFESIANKEGNPAENTLLMLREKRKVQQEEVKSVLEKVAGKGAEWKTFFNKEKLKEKFYDLLAGKWKDKKAKKMSAKEFEESLEKDGLTTAYEALKTGLMAKEVLDISTGVAKSAGSVLKKGGAGLAAGGGAVLGGSYRRILKPAGSGLLRAGKWTAGKVGGGLKWGIGKAKYAAFPLVIAGGILGAAWAWAKEPWHEKDASGGGSHH